MNESSNVLSGNFPFVELCVDTFSCPGEFPSGEFFIDELLSRNFLLKTEMLRSKTGKTRTPVSEEALKDAVNVVLAGNMMIREAARHSVPYLDISTNYLKQAAKYHYGLTRKEAKTLAYQYAEQNNKIMPQKWHETGTAGREWLRWFMKRHKSLSLRTPESTSLARSTSFNNTNVSNFFQNLRACIEKRKFQPNQIYNIDETGNTNLLTFPPHSSHKLLPLDRTVFGPYKTYYNQCANDWLLQNPGKPITIYQIAEIVGKSYPKAFTQQNIIKGFQVTDADPNVVLATNSSSPIPLPSTSTLSISTPSSTQCNVAIPNLTPPGDSTNATGILQEIINTTSNQSIGFKSPHLSEGRATENCKGWKKERENQNFDVDT
ncbi:hypothetical protein NQ315_002825 [Exocentrus adspersus]|uniref:DDE-1 domain-containing protein n=1 Tax=Exocentrus adspersus TaxID=1586481 RepID=A0AAV8VE36_9CUCU|nr:hypothetical protein NQ315_002825 [Exocentrus adspersus]